MSVRTIHSGVVSSGLNVGSGAELIVDGGGVASRTTIAPGGLEIISAEGSGVVTTVRGSQVVDGTALSATILFGGQEFVGAGGRVSSWVVSGGEQTVLGSAISGVLRSATVSGHAAEGLETVSSGGVAQDLSILRGGVQEVLAGGFTASVGISAGGLEVVSGVADEVDIYAGGPQSRRRPRSWPGSSSSATSCRRAC